MRTVVALAAALSVAVASGAALAHPPDVDDEGTPDAAPRAPESEIPVERPGVSGVDASQAGAPSYAEAPRWPSTLPYYPWARVPDGYELKMGGTRKALLVSGITVFATAHVVSAISAVTIATDCSSCSAHAAESAIPVVGPFFAFAAHGASDPNALYMTLGMVQVAGFAMLLAGATLDDKRLVLKDGARRLSLAPTFGPGAAGFALRGDL
jgi:hypothetical protein